MPITNYGFNAGLGTKSLIKSQEIKQQIIQQKHKQKDKTQYYKALKLRQQAQKEMGLAPYEIFLNRLKTSERNQRRRITSKQLWEMYKKHKKEMLRNLDAKKKDYKTLNKWRLKAFANVELTRSISGHITAGKAWAMLHKCWNGYFVNMRFANFEAAQYYADGINKYLWMLEEPQLTYESIKEFKG